MGLWLTETKLSLLYQTVPAENEEITESFRPDNQCSFRDAKVSPFEQKSESLQFVTCRVIIINCLH